MRRFARLYLLASFSFLGCDAILGIGPHDLAEDGGTDRDATVHQDASVPVDGAAMESGRDRATAEDVDARLEDAPDLDDQTVSNDADAGFDPCKGIEGGCQMGILCIACSATLNGAVCLDASRCGCVGDQDCTYDAAPRCDLSTHQCCFAPGVVCMNNSDCCSGDCSGTCL
jgi:hypothetical protein